jgi:hypothetical protein
MNWKEQLDVSSIRAIRLRKKTAFCGKQDTDACLRKCSIIISYIPKINFQKMQSLQFVLIIFRFEAMYSYVGYLVALANMAAIVLWEHPTMPPAAVYRAQLNTYTGLLAALFTAPLSSRNRSVRPIIGQLILTNHRSVSSGQSQSRLTSWNWLAGPPRWSEAGRRPPRNAIQKFKDSDIQNYISACCFVWVWKLVAHIEGAT